MAVYSPNDQREVERGGRGIAVYRMERRGDLGGGIIARQLPEISATTWNRAIPARGYTTPIGAEFAFPPPFAQAGGAGGMTPQALVSIPAKGLCDP